MPRDPHRDQPVLRGGTPLADAAAALVLLHGRAGSAQEMLTVEGGGGRWRAVEGGGGRWRTVEDGGGGSGAQQTESGRSSSVQREHHRPHDRYGTRADRADDHPLGHALLELGDFQAQFSPQTG